MKLIVRAAASAPVLLLRLVCDVTLADALLERAQIIPQLPGGEPLVAHGLCGSVATPRNELQRKEEYGRKKVNQRMQVVLDTWKIADMRSKTLPVHLQT